MSVVERIKQLRRVDRDRLKQQSRDEKEGKKQAKLSIKLEPTTVLSKAELERFRQLQAALERLDKSGAIEMAKEIKDKLRGSRLMIVPDLANKSTLKPNDFDSVKAVVGWDRQEKTGKANRMVDNTPDFERYADVKVRWETFEELAFIAPVDTQEIMVIARCTSTKPSDVSAREHGLIQHFELTVGQYQWCDKGLFQEMVASKVAISGISKFF